MSLQAWLLSALLAVAVGAEPSPEFLKLPAHDVERIGTTEKVRVGDAIELRIPGPKGANEAQLRPAPGAESLVEQGWELIPEKSLTPDEMRFKAVPLKPGKLTLPSLAIVGKGESSIGRTNPIELDVESAIANDDPKPEEAAALRPPVGLKFPWWVILVGALLFLAAAAALFRIYKKWKGLKAKPESAAPVAPPRPEDVVALEALDALEKGGALRRGEFKKHYFGISEIVKAYVGARYRFDASESTTREMIAMLEDKRSLSDRELDGLEVMFEKLDLVKFTDHVPMSDEGARLLDTAREFVRTTRRPPPLPETVGGVAK